MINNNSKFDINNNIFNEMLTKQRKNIDPNKKLLYSDIKRIAKYLTNSIFDENNCTIWNGYITNSKHIDKGVYINFYFRKKKVALHRILYINYVDNLGTDEYLKYNCENGGRCCNVNHFAKHKYKKNNINDNQKKADGEIIKNIEQIEINDDKFNIVFD